jgi:hypothetical protein
MTKHPELTLESLLEQYQPALRDAGVAGAPRLPVSAWIVDLLGARPSVPVIVGVTLLKVALFIGLMLLVGRRLVPALLHHVAHGGSRELFRLAVLATALGIASGAVAGLVAITPACGFVGPMSSIIIGLAGGAVCYFAVSLKSKFGYDDSLDVVGVHAVGGTLGALMTGLFASKLVNSAGGDGLFFGNAAQLGTQAVSVLAAWVYSFVVTLIILKILDVTMGLRVSEEEESEGLDLSQHGETGYIL